MQAASESRMSRNVTEGNRSGIARRYPLGRGGWRDRKRHLEACAALRRRSDHNPPVVGDDDLEDQREAEPGASALGREERAEHALADRRIDAAAVVVERDPADPLAAVHGGRDAD